MDGIDRLGRRWLAAAALACAACKGENLAPPQDAGPPYLAIINRFDAREGAGVGERYTYRVQAIAEGVRFDTVVTAAPRDTVILSVRPADYTVTVEGVPTNCFPRSGPTQGVLISEGSNTGIVRFFIVCDPPLSVELVTDGRLKDSAYVFRLSGAGTDTLGVARGDEVLVFPGIAEGDYTFELADVAPNCVVTSTYGDRVPVRVPATGRAQLLVRITCSEPDRRPEILSAVSRSVDGVATLFVLARDPDRDIERIAWELTDCTGRPLAPDGRRIRQNLAVSGAVVRDTSVISSVFETGFSDAELRARCAQVLLFDLDGNSTPPVEMRILAPSDGAPVATFFNARIVNQQALETTLQVDDPQRDEASVFPVIHVRDGVLFATDGRPDLGVYAPAGYRFASDIPSLRLGAGSRIQPFDVLALDVYLFDRTGDVRRVRDTDFRF